MKLFIYTTLILSGIYLTGCQTTRNLYLVRHAEKSTEPAADPHLTQEGKNRSEILTGILVNKNIKAIFSTRTNRTVETATPLSQKINVPVQYYSNDTLQKFLQSVIHLNRSALIVGHSNTLTAMLNIINLPHTITSIADADYDNIFIIKAKNGKPTAITETAYGNFKNNKKATR